MIFQKSSTDQQGDSLVQITADGDEKSCDWIGRDRWACCSASNQCGIGEGDCDYDIDCSNNLICGSSNCGANFHPLADCCEEPNLTPEYSLTESGKL